MASKWLLYVASVLLISAISAVSADSSVELTNQYTSNCSTPHNETGECIRLEDCLVLYGLIFRGNLSNEEKDYMAKSQCRRSADKVIWVCCPPSSGRPDTAELFNTRSIGKPKIGGDGNSLDENGKANSDIAPGELRQKPKSRACGPCATGTGEVGVCIKLVECEYMVNILLNNLTLSNKEYLRRSQCSFENGNVLVCCPLKTTSDQFGSFDGTSLLPTPDDCRVPSDDRIPGGNKTKIDEYTFMAVLGYKASQSNPIFLCGGTLINNRYVLTAAHCTKTMNYNGEDYVLELVRLGEWDLGSEKDCDAEDDCSDPVIDSAIEKVIVHENYQMDQLNQPNDIALLRLAQIVPYSFWVRPICLPLAPHLRVASFLGDEMHIAGWGVYKSRKRSQFKLKARVKVIDFLECAKQYRRVEKPLEDNQICAGGEEGVDSCFGDSGGPLIGIDTSDKLQQYYFVAGVISFGTTECGLKDWPAVHGRVGHYVDWIRRKIRP